MRCNFQGELRDPPSLLKLCLTVPVNSFGLLGNTFHSFKVSLWSFYRDAEEILREKELGCFLIRLSDKAIAYILSYK